MDLIQIADGVVIAVIREVARNPATDPNSPDWTEFPAGKAVPGMVMVDGILQAPPPPPPTVEDVRAEEQARMIALLGARDPAHLEILISNGSREAIRLIRKGAENWTPEEAIRAAQIEAIDAALAAIRAASNALEAMVPIPDNYDDDGRWPAF